MNGTPASESVRLHDYWRSSAAYRVRIALNLKGIAYQSVPHDLRHGAQSASDYVALNPQGLVPALEIDGLVLTQSLAIVDYLDARVPDPRFVPQDPAARSHVLAMALTIACDIHPLDNLRVLRYLKDPLGHDQAAIDAWYGHWLIDGLNALESLAARHAGTYLSGDVPGIADICLTPQLYNARRYEIDLSPYPTLCRIDAQLATLPAFQAAHPDRWEPKG